MRYGTLGDSGLLVSVVGLGCNNFGGRLDVEQTRAVVDAAIDEGITLFDTAETYGGAGRLRTRARRGPAGPPGQGRARHQVRQPELRHGLRPGGGRARAAATTSRSRWRSPSPGCKTDYIDLYQLHTPDPVTPIDETLAALDDLVTEGKVRYLGHSNFSGWQIADAAHSRGGGGPDAVHLRPEPLVAARAARRARGGAGRAALRRRPAALLPARQRPAHRQGPPRPGASPRAPGWPSRAGPATSPTPSSTRSSR